MKRQKPLLQPEDRNQLLAYAGEAIRPHPGSFKLHNHESVSPDNQEDQQSQRERQTPAELEVVAVRCLHAMLLRLSERTPAEQSPEWARLYRTPL